MIDLTDSLLRAEQYDSLWSKDSLRSLIDKKEAMIFDWDMECGERWATIFLDHKFIGYISSVVPIAFCKTVSLKEIERILDEKVIIINEDDLDDKKWFIDPRRLEKCSLKLNWIIREQVLDLGRFSINDLWYATI